MGAYADSTTIINRLGNARAAELTAESGTTPDTSLINTVIYEIENLVDSYLVRRVAVPVSVVTAPYSWLLIKGKVVDLVLYHIHLRRPPVPEDWKAAHDEALAWLKAVAEGELILPDGPKTQTMGDYGSNKPSAAELRDV